MNTQAVEIIETEVPLEESMSLNHSRLMGRTYLALTQACGEQFDVLPELECEMSAGRFKPDVALVPRQVYNWEKDLIRYPGPPITAIEILSPTQTLDELVVKIREGYLASGAQSGWLIAPVWQTVTVYLPDQPALVVSSGQLRDPATGVEIELAKIFQ